MLSTSLARSSSARAISAAARSSQGAAVAPRGLSGVLGAGSSVPLSSRTGEAVMQGSIARHLPLAAAGIAHRPPAPPRRQGSPTVHAASSPTIHAALQRNSSVWLGHQGPRCALLLDQPAVQVARELAIPLGVGCVGSSGLWQLRARPNRAGRLPKAPPPPRHGHAAAAACTPAAAGSSMHPSCSSLHDPQGQTVTHFTDG